MTWINSPLNAERTPNDVFFDSLYKKGLGLADDVVAATTKISALTIKDPDFAGINPILIDPSGLIAGMVTPDKPIQQPLNAVTVDAQPDVPVLTAELVATDIMLIDLITRGKAELEYQLSHATGLTADVETALFARAVDRETKLQRSGYQNYLANNAAMGFEAASGQDMAAFLHFETEKKGKLSDINRDIMLKQAELEQSNRQKILDQFIAFDSRLLDLKQSDEANKLHLYDSRLTAWEKRIRVFIDINQSIIDQFGQLVEVYAKEIGLEISKKELLLNQYNSLNGYNSQLTNIALEKLRVMDSHNIGKYNALSEGQKAVGATLGQLSASLFNTMNYSQSWSNSIGWSGSESVAT